MKLVIRLNKLKFYAFHGVHDFENKSGNWFIVDFEGEYPYSVEAQDSIESTADYEKVEKIIAEEMEKAKKLIETVALNISKRVLTEIGFHEVKVNIRKQSPPLRTKTDSSEVKLTLHSSEI